MHAGFCLQDNQGNRCRREQSSSCKTSLHCKRDKMLGRGDMLCSPFRANCRDFCSKTAFIAARSKAYPNRRAVIGLDRSEVRYDNRPRLCLTVTPLRRSSSANSSKSMPEDRADSYNWQDIDIFSWLRYNYL